MLPQQNATPAIRARPVQRRRGSRRVGTVWVNLGVISRNVGSLRCLALPLDQASIPEPPRRRLETNSVAVEVESAAGRRLCVFRDGLRERVARIFKRIFACDGLRVPVKKLALAVDV